MVDNIEIKKTNNITETPDTPESPLIEPENEDISFKVINNSEKGENKTHTVDKKSEDKNTFKKVIRILFIILVIINLFPFVMTIIEIILRSKNNCKFNDIVIGVMSFYLSYFLMLIPICFVPEMLYQAVFIYIVFILY